MRIIDSKQIELKKVTQAQGCRGPPQDVKTCDLGCHLTQIEIQNNTGVHSPAKKSLLQLHVCCQDDVENKNDVHHDGTSTLRDVICSSHEVRTHTLDLE